MRKSSLMLFSNHFRERISLYCAWHYSLIHGFYLHPLLLSFKSCDHRNSTHPDSKRKRSSYIDVLYSDEENRDKYFCSMYRAMNRSHILMEKKFIAAWTCLKCKLDFFPFYCLFSIIFMEFSFLHRIDQFWLIVTSHHKCFLLLFVLFFIFYFFLVEMHLPVLKSSLM